MRNDPFQRLDLDREVLTVSQLNQRARLLPEGVSPQIWVEGELSDLAWPVSGHVHFTPKDSNAQICCALFRQDTPRVCQTLRDGLTVKVHGGVSPFEGRGDYQLIANTVEPAGDGALRLAFEALKEKFAGEGLFASKRKRLLPTCLRHISVVNLPNGVVIRDIISTFRRRAPQVELVLALTAVQGRKAAVQIVRALQLADQQGLDVLTLVWDGSSLEDLWCFNEEAVAHAAAACTTPIVSVVDHETNVSISDFAVDVRTPTSSAAVELLVPNADDLQQHLDGLHRHLMLCTRDQLLRKHLYLEGVIRHLRHPDERLRQQAQRLDDLGMCLCRAFERQLAVRHERLVRLETRLVAQHPGCTLVLLRQKFDSLAVRPPCAAHEALRGRCQRLEEPTQTLNVVSPLATLGRGYSILLDKRGRTIRDIGQTQPGQRLKAHLVEDGLEVQVEGNHRTPVTLSLLG